jgi:hypothetical protein
LATAHQSQAPAQRALSDSTERLTKRCSELLRAVRPFSARA